ncbi:unnamed protein product [Chondrus crispus]|uniref:BRO1 domain-containing protein n=1 Tax=Chondrus crispus TaxID=2769 RepID=R7QG82_CHOCR|nr:unnamed protein product [Chondrus crispus]CDF37512.1 unnamed protein product [Chondrus crispus]|eukprot:XP_005717383.1 unnamed protein product [Chondrus crispus]
MSSLELTTPRPSRTPSRTAVLESERVLAAIEVRLRTTAAPVAPHNPSLEALGDAYTARLAGHALDNLDRAIISYRLAERRLRHVPDATLPRARLLSKLGKAWYSRLVLAQQGAVPGTRAVPVHARGHLNTAFEALDEAVNLFKERDVTDAAYIDALRVKGLVSGALCQLLSDDAGDTNDTKEKLPKKVSPHRYANECIASLEPVLQIPHDNATSDPAKLRRLETITGVDRAEAVICLARAYVHVDSGRQQIGKAVGLLASVSGILKDVEAEGKDGDALQNMTREAEAQIVALSGSVKVVESRCLVC